MKNTGSRAGLQVDMGAGKTGIEDSWTCVPEKESARKMSARCGKIVFFAYSVQKSLHYVQNRNKIQAWCFTLYYDSVLNI